MGSVFEPASQHADVDAKIVASLERLWVASSGSCSRTRPRSAA